MKSMSDEFIRVATKEINEEIDSVAEILKSCNNNSSVIKKASLIEKHFHKIKGLAPMMGKEMIGEIATLNDSLLNHILDGKHLEGVYSILCESNSFMEQSIKNLDINSAELKQKIETNYSKFLD